MLHMLIVWLPTVLATIFALVAFALSAQSKAAENNLVKSTTLVVYSSMGIATGVLTLITMPIMYDAFLSPVSGSGRFFANSHLWIGS